VGFLRYIKKAIPAQVGYGQKDAVIIAVRIRRVDAMPGDDKQRDGFIKSLSFLSQIGVTIIACIAVGILFGSFLDSLLGTTPWLLLVFILLGIVAAFKSILDLAKKH